MPSRSDMQALVEQMRRLTDGASGGRSSGREAVIATGWDAVDEALGDATGAGDTPGATGGLRCGAVHEWFGADEPPLCVLEHLARRVATRDARRVVVWIGRACWPYPWALAHGSVDVLGEALWVDPPDAGARLWAIDQAARCAGVAAVIADGSALTMAATRRLQLAARAAGTLVLLSRPGRERDRLSAATTRWLVRPARSPTGRPRWKVTLIRCKSASLGTGSGSGVTTRAGPPPTWRLEWDDATAAIHLAGDVGDRSGDATTSATERHDSRDPSERHERRSA